MYIHYARLLLVISVILLCEPCRAVECDSTLSLVIDPTADIKCDINKRVPVDVQIVAYKVRFPRAVYECFAKVKGILLITRFDELLQLEEQIQANTRAGFIQGIQGKIKYTPNGYVFASINKETDRVVLSVDILDFSATVPASETLRMSFSDFLRDSLVHLKLKGLCDSLTHQLCGNESHGGRPPVDIRLGFSLQSGGDWVTLGNIPQDIRIVPPHPHDLEMRPEAIADTGVFENYFIGDNTVRFQTGHSTALELELRFWEVLHVGLRTSRLEASGVVLGQNIFRKSYIEPIDTTTPAGSALIFYSVEAKARDFLSQSSLSIVVSLSYPLYRFGDTRPITFRGLAGSNVLLPESIELESRQGWDRFGAKEVQKASDIGELKRVHYFFGISTETTLGSWNSLSFEVVLNFNEYREDLRDGITLGLQRRVHPEFKVRWTAILLR